MRSAVDAPMTRLAEPAIREALSRTLKDLGFRYVTLDLEGFRSGNLNDLVPLDTKRLFAISHEV